MTILSLPIEKWRKISHLKIPSGNKDVAIFCVIKRTGNGVMPKKGGKEGKEVKAASYLASTPKIRATKLITACSSKKS